MDLKIVQFTTTFYVGTKCLVLQIVLFTTNFYVGTKCLVRQIVQFTTNFYVGTKCLVLKTLFVCTQNVCFRAKVCFQNKIFVCRTICLLLELSFSFQNKMYDVLQQIVLLRSNCSMFFEDCRIGFYIPR